MNSVLQPAQSRDWIVSELQRVHRDSAAYWSSSSTATFMTPIGTAWSPADNVRHLTKSIRAVTRGLTLPHFVVRLVGGTARRPSRSYEEVRDAYLAVLATGVQAGRFSPDPESVVADPEARRAQIMAWHEAAVAAHLVAIERWNEQELDSYRLPHPALGKLTLRELLFFTIYHNMHHVQVVQRRLAAKE